MTWPVISFRSNAGTRCAHLTDAKKTATSAACQRSTDPSGIDVDNDGPTLATLEKDPVLVGTGGIGWLLELEDAETPKFGDVGVVVLDDVEDVGEPCCWLRIGRSVPDMMAACWLADQDFCVQSAAEAVCISPQI